MRCLVLVLVAMASSSVSKAGDTEISILALRDGGADPSKVAQQLVYIDDFWPDSAIGLNFINGFQAIKITNSILSGSSSSQLTQAQSISLPGDATKTKWEEYRDGLGADVVLMFTGGASNCGLAVQTNWIKPGTPGGGVFQVGPGSSTYDLHGAENGYFALVVANSSCPEHVALHELGHLLGGGHTPVPPGSLGSYLNDDSHALALSIYIPPYIDNHYQTVLAEGQPLACQSRPNGQCNVNDQFSALSGYNDNTATIAQTAPSVANYRVVPDMTNPPAPPPPTISSGCTLKTPQIVQGGLIDVCNNHPVFGLGSVYYVQWSPGCTSATTEYEIWYSQPDGSGYNHLADSVNPWAEIQVGGANSRIRVKACSATSCTGLSPTSYVLVDEC